MEDHKKISRLTFRHYLSNKFERYLLPLLISSVFMLSDFLFGLFLLLFISAMIIIIYFITEGVKNE